MFRNIPKNSKKFQKVPKNSKILDTFFKVLNTFWILFHQFWKYFDIFRQKCIQIEKIQPKSWKLLAEKTGSMVKYVSLEKSNHFSAWESRTKVSSFHHFLLQVNIVCNRSRNMDRKPASLCKVNLNPSWSQINAWEHMESKTSRSDAKALEDTYAPLENDESTFSTYDY